MSYLDHPEQDRIVFFSKGDMVIAAGRPTGLVWLWGEYRVILSDVKIPLDARAVLIGFDEFDRMEPGHMIFDRDHDDDATVRAKLEREFSR